jgi:hypothetical protein
MGGESAGLQGIGGDEENMTEHIDEHEDPYCLSWKVPLWDAIDDYVRACGCDPNKHVYGNTTRQRAVVAVETVVRALIDEKREQETP